jgi:anti-anti-sigma factor
LAIQSHKDGQDFPLREHPALRGHSALAGCAEVLPIMSKEQLTIETIENSGAISVKVEGVLTFVTVQQFKQHLDTWVQPGTRQIALDLAGMRLIDSAGIGFLLQGIGACRDRNIDFKVRNVPKTFMAVMRETGLTGIFDT